MQRRSADRRAWELVTRRRFAMARVDEADFAGYATLLLIDAVTAPLVGPRSGLRLADAGFAWMTHFPDGVHHTVTTMYDAAGEVIQWYVDICREHGLDAAGMPWFDDLYLDLVVYPDGRVVVLDADELDDALAHGAITQAEHDLAWREARRLLAAIEAGEFGPILLAPRSAAHRALLLRLVTEGRRA